MITGLESKPSISMPHLVIGGRVHRAAQGPRSAVENPPAGLRQQGPGDGFVVDGLEKPEKAHFLGMKPIVVPIEDSRHPAHRLAIAQGQEELRLGVGVERVLLAVEQFLHRYAQWGNPVRVPAI